MAFYQMRIMLYYDGQKRLLREFLMRRNHFTWNIWCLLVDFGKEIFVSYTYRHVKRKKKGGKLATPGIPHALMPISVNLSRSQQGEQRYQEVSGWRERLFGVIWHSKTALSRRRHGSNIMHPNYIMFYIPSSSKR